MIDTDTAKQILQGDDTHPDILQALGLELLAEVKRLREYDFETLMHWLLKVRDSHWEDKDHVLERIEEGYDLKTMIYIYESRVEMTACSIEQGILDTLKELIE